MSEGRDIERRGDHPVKKGAVTGNEVTRAKS